MNKKDVQKEIREAWIAEGEERSQHILNILEFLVDHVDDLNRNIKKEQVAV